MSNNTGGYNAGSIYADFQLKVGNLEAQIADIEKSLERLRKSANSLRVEEEALNKVMNNGSVAKGTEEYSKLEKRLQTVQRQLRLNIEQQEIYNKLINNIKPQVSGLKYLSSMMKDANNSIPTEGIHNFTASLNALRIAISGVLAHRLYDYFIESGAALETTIASFEVLLQSYEKAQVLTDELIEMAARTPLVTSDLTEGAKRLLAVGVELEDVNSTLEMLGDLAMGDSIKLNRLINAFGKIQTAGRGTLEYLNYFTEAGVPVIEALADTLGVTTEEFFKLSRAGKVTSEQVNAALRSLTAEGGKFYGMMEKQSKTYSGLMSTLKDNLQIIGREIGTEAFEQLKDYITEIIDSLEELEKTGKLDEITEDWGHALADVVKTIGSFLSGVYEFRDIIGSVVAALVGMKTATFALNTALTLTAGTLKTFSSVALAVAGSGAIIAKSVYELKNNMGELTDKGKELTETNEKLIKSYDKESKSLYEQGKNALELADRLEELNSKEKLSAEEKEELKEIINQLNLAYEGLNLELDNEDGKVNRNIKSVQEYIKAWQDMKTLEIKLQLAEDLEKQIAETELEIQSMQEDLDNILSQRNSLTFEDFFKEKHKDKDDGFFSKFFWGENKLDEYGEYITLTVTADKAIEDLSNSINKASASNEENREKLQLVTAEIENFGKTSEEAGNDLKEAENNLKTYEEILSEVKKELEDTSSSQKKIFESMQSEIDDTISSISTLSSTLAQEGDILELNKSETEKLVKLYPELVDKIKETAEGYEIERSEIQNLIDAQIEAQSIAIDAEIQKTQQTIDSAKERIGAYHEEILEITTLAEAQMALANIQGMQELNPDKKTQYQQGIIVKNWKDNVGEAVRDATEEEVNQMNKNLSETGEALKEVLIPAFERLEELSKKSEENTKRMQIAASTTGEKAKKTGETEAEKQIRNLKYDLDMEYITQKEYYDKLEALKDKYYSEGTKQWQQYTLEITKGRKKMQEENAKAELQDYEDRLKDSYSWIEEEQFYSRLSDDETIAAYERIRAYTKEYYEQGKIDFKRYVEEIKKLDKEIYSIQKENLQDSNKELSDLRKKRYDDAVKQIEDYYDELERAEEEYERRKEMGELQTLASLYEGAVTKTGKQRYDEIQDEIEELTRESERATREAQKEADLKKLEETYNNLEETQTAYFDTVLNYSEEVTSKIQEMTRIVNESFSNIDSIIGGSMAGQNNNVVYNQTLNQTNNITDKASGQAVIDLTAVAYRYGLGG